MFGVVIGASLLLTGFRSALQTSVGQSLASRFGNGGRKVRPIAPISVSEFRRPRAARTIAAWRFIDDVGPALPGVRPAWQSMRIETATDAAARCDDRRGPLHPGLARARHAAADRRADVRAGRYRPVVPGRRAQRGGVRELFEGDPIGRTIEDPIGQRLEVVGVVAERAPARPRARHPDVSIRRAGQKSRRESGLTPLRVPERSSAGERNVRVNVVSPSYLRPNGPGPVAGRTFRDAAASLSCRVRRDQSGGCRAGTLAVTRLAAPSLMARVAAQRSSASSIRRCMGRRSDARSQRSTCRWRRIFDPA